MKLSISKLLFVLAIFSLTSCIKNDPIVWEGAVVEFDAAVLNTPATGKTYPLLTRVPGYGRPVFTSTPADPTITRSSGAVKFRVNLVGPQTNTERTLTYKVVAAETTAVSGTHYTTTGTFTIPANSSFGEITVNIINPGVSSSTPVDLVLELEGNAEIKPSENYKKLGIRISQT